MISPAWVAMMARYNSWQNGWMLPACDGLSDTTRHVDRGLYFASIQGTLSHILWADHMMLARFRDAPPPDTPLRASGSYVTDWETLKARRAETDADIVAWADEVTQEFLDGELDWVSAVTGTRLKRPRAQVVTHLFNHQAHHRGQVHASLTIGGIRTQTTDMFLLEDPA